MSGVNKVIIVGNLGKDPEIRTFQSGGRVASFSVATSESWKDKATGEKKERTEWHRISVFNDHLITVIEKFASKGTKVYLEGRLETRKWTDQSGAEKHTTEIVLRPFHGELQILDFGNGNVSAPADEGQKYSKAAKETYQAQAVPGLDDEIPF